VKSRHAPTTRHVVSRIGVLDLRLDLGDAALDVPAPLTIVVFSLSIITFLALPSMSSSTRSSLMPRSSEIAVPPGLLGQRHFSSHLLQVLG